MEKAEVFSYILYRFIFVAGPLLSVLSVIKSTFIQELYSSVFIMTIKQVLA